MRANLLIARPSDDRPDEAEMQVTVLVSHHAVDRHPDDRMLDLDGLARSHHNAGCQGAGLLRRDPVGDPAGRY